MHRKLRVETWEALVAGAWLLVFVAGCDSSEGLISLPCMEVDGPCISSGEPDGGGPDSAWMPRADADSVDAGPSRSPLCGTIGCYPGNPSACGATMAGDAQTGGQTIEPDASDAPDAMPVDDAPDASSDGPSDASLASISDGSSESSDGALQPAADVSLDASNASDTAASFDAGATDEPKMPESCYVRPSNGAVVTECAPVGQGAAASTCDDSSDCGALLACVDVNQKPVCRPFSCALPAQCPAGSFYQLASLRVQGTTLSDVKVPVCLPDDHCELLLTPGTCPAGLACAVVGSEGETTCVVPGSGKLGDSCDDQSKLCADGLVCSKSKNQCLQICHVSAAMTECPGGTCQGGNRYLPDGFGICVGASPDGG